MCASYNLNKNIHNVLVNIKEHFCLTKSERIDCLFMLCEHRLPGSCVSGNLWLVSGYERETVMWSHANVHDPQQWWTLLLFLGSCHPWSPRPLVGMPLGTAAMSLTVLQGKTVLFVDIGLYNAGRIFYVTNEKGDVTWQIERSLGSLHQRDVKGKLLACSINLSFKKLILSHSEFIAHKYFF